MRGSADARWAQVNGIRVTVAATAAMLCIASMGWAGQSTPARQRVDVSKLGPQVGAQVPDVSLPDQTGTVRTLSSIMGPRGAMIVFMRSADW
jgi:hypothetical protein